MYSFAGLLLNLFLNSLCILMLLKIKEKLKLIFYFRVHSFGGSLFSRIFLNLLASLSALNSILQCLKPVRGNCLSFPSLRDWKVPSGKKPEICSSALKSRFPSSLLVMVTLQGFQDHFLVILFRFYHCHLQEDQSSQVIPLFLLSPYKIVNK